MILDKKLHGTIDQANLCLIVFDADQPDVCLLPKLSAPVLCALHTYILLSLIRGVLYVHVYGPPTQLHQETPSHSDGHGGLPCRTANLGQGSKDMRQEVRFIFTYWRTWLSTVAWFEFSLGPRTCRRLARALLGHPLRILSQSMIPESNQYHAVS